VEQLMVGLRRAVFSGAASARTAFALDDDTPITSRAPKLYLKLGERGGTPADFAVAGYGGTISVVGTPAAYGVLTSKGTGIRLGTAAYLQASHHAVFTTSGAATANTIVESEATFSIHCAFPAVLQNDWVIFSKADNATDLSSSVSLRVHANGSVELRVREHKYRPDVRMRTAAGVVTQGSEHHFTVSLGYAGAWFTVDGRQAELGFKNTLAWWGLDHRHNGVEEGGTAVSTRVTNTSAIRLGRTGDQSTSADIVVTKFAVFYGGVARTTKGQQTLGLTLADAQALAGASGPALPDPRFSAVSHSPAAGANTIQAAINAATPNGTVILSGNYTQSVDLVLKKGVRLTTSGSATVTFTNDAKLTSAVPTAMPALTGGGTLAAGAQTYAAANSLTDDAVFVVVDRTALGTLYQVQGVHNLAAKKSDMIPLRSRTASAVTFTRAPFFTYATGTRLATRGFEPTVDIAIDGNITFTRNGGTEANTLLQLHALRRARFNGITVRQTTTTVEYLLACILYGCVEVAFNGCTVTTTSPQGADSSRHPYAMKFAGCANYDVFAHTGHSNGWHALDNESDNVDDVWGLNSAVPTAVFSGQFGDIRNSTMSSTNNNFPCICHTSNHIRMLDLAFTSGGGTSIDGYAHNIETIVANSGGRNTQIAHTRGVGATRIWHCDFNNNLGNWGNGSFGMTKCNYGDLHYLTPPDTSTFGRVPHDGSNIFTDVDTARNGLPL
jgi:hypothetical protein